MSNGSDRNLALALEAERFVRSLARATDDGVAWGHSRERPDQVSRALYAGSAGIILFYLELHAATGQAQFLEQAVAGADDVAAHVRTTPWQSCSSHSGWPGLAFALAEVAHATGEARFSDAARHSLGRLRGSAVERGAGIAWIEPMPYAALHGFQGEREVHDASIGAAAAGFAFLDAARRGLDPRALDWARAVAERLLEVAIPTEGGLNWSMMSDMPFRWRPSNFAHGGAGVGTFLASLFEATRDERFLAAARAAAAHVMHVAHRVGDGHLVPHHDGARGALYYLSTCHGPAGTTRLMHVLHRVTGEAQYAAWTEGALRGLLGTGAPEHRSAGFWNNVSQCCGDAGVGDYALHGFRSSGDGRYLDLALREAAELDRRGELGSQGRAWPQAEHRERPDFIEAQSGYMQGAAGIGSFFVQLATTQTGHPVKIALPDTPFPSTYG